MAPHRPDELLEHLRGFEEAGVDQVILIQRGENNQHAHICESLELFAGDGMGGFHDRHEQLARERRDRLEPAIERKEPMAAAEDDEIPRVVPFDRDVSAYE